MLQQEIPMKWIAVIFSVLAACMFFGWVYIATPSMSAQLYADCMELPDDPDMPDKKRSCHLVAADLFAEHEAEAACASHESSKIQKCEWVPSRNYPTVAKQTRVGSGTDVKIVTFLRYRDDWNDVHYAYYTVRLTRASMDDPDWHVAKSEFSLQRE